ncbi:P-loop containing nucleoside triphosphate hydrolase protein [Pilaira anomala]|nr:P-loop containing nucleoside triphosphate hydrolase protein [Pilaira anomala]
MSLSHLLNLPSLQQKLRSAGYESLEEILSSNLTEIVQDLHLSSEEQKQIFRVVNTERREREVVDQNEEFKSISTHSRNIDALFGHGIPPKRITEISGESGSGKTQLCTQLAVNSLGLETGECIYIDTEGSFKVPERVSNIQDLNRLHVFRALNYTELVALINQLPNILETYPDTKIIIIDSIAFHFRINVLSKNERNRMLDHIGSSLYKLAKQNNLAIVVSNNVTREEEASAWVPSLGSSWGNWCNHRLFLYRKRLYRYAYLYKSDPRATRPVQFCIKGHGIADPEEDELEEDTIWAV